MAQSTNKTSTRAITSSYTSFDVPFYNNDTPKAPVRVNGGDVRIVTDTFSGSKNPGWRDKVRKVMDATTPASGVRTKVKLSPCTVGYDYYTQDPDKVAQNLKGQFHRRGAASGTLFPDHFFSALDTVQDTSNSSQFTSADNQAIAKLYEQLESFESSAQAGEDAAESHKTLSLLRKPMSGLQSVTSDFLQRHEKALSIRGLQRSAKAMADATLEWRFAIKPVTKTVAGAIVGLQNRDYVGSYFPFSAKGETTSKSIWGAYSESMGVVSVYVNERWVRKTQVQYQGVWGVEASVDRRSVSDVLSLNWKNVAPTVYNIIPWTWLLDYATNIGNIVESLQVPWAGVKWCCKTSRLSSVYDAQTTGQVFAVSQRFRDHSTHSPGFTHLEKTSFIRRRVTQMPVPKLEFRNPFGSVGQAQNIAALIIGRLPIIGSGLKKALNRNPSLPQAYKQEMRRRGEKVPYPFH